MVTKYKWREEDTPIFLEYYKNYQCLWNYKIHEYKNRELRYNALTSLLEDLGGEECGLDIEIIKSKIKTIRTKYTSELGKVRRSGNVYVPTVPWYKQADEFLGAVAVPRSTSPYHEMPKRASSKKCSQIKYESEWNSEDEEKKAVETDAAEAGMESECAVTPDSPPIVISHRPSRRRQSRKRSSSSDEVETKRKRYNAPTAPQDDIATFATYVGAQLRKFPTRLRCIAKLEINQLLYKLEMEDIEESPNSVNIEHETNSSRVKYGAKLQPGLNCDPLTKDEINEASSDCDE